MLLMVRPFTSCHRHNQRTNGPVNAHLFWTIVLVVELMTPVLGCGMYGPQGVTCMDHIGHTLLHTNFESSEPCGFKISFVFPL